MVKDMISEKKENIVLTIVGAGIIFLGVFYYFRPAEIPLLRMTFLAIFFTPLISLLFLYHPIKKGMKIRWYDICLGILGAISSIYIALNAYELESMMRGATILEVILGCIMLIVVAEAARRTVGWPISVLMIVLCIQPLIGSRLPGVLKVNSVGLDILIENVYLTSSGMFGMLLNVWATVILPFVFFGHLMTVGGGGQVVFDISSALVGRTAGGPAKIAVVASGGMGTMTGGPITNVAITGQITIPMMKKLGYTPVFAGAVEAAASNGGSIMPPIMGTVAFIMADYLGISYGEVCIASIIPAVSYYLCIFAQVHFEAKKLGLLGLTRDAVPPFWNSLLKGWYIVVVLAALVIFLMVFRYTPGRTGYYCIGLFILVSSITRNTRLNLKQILEALKGTMMMLMKLAPVMAAAGVIMASFGMSGLGLQLAQGIVSFSGGYTFILLLLAAVMSFIMGMGLYALVSYILLAVMVGPILTKAGIPPLASHLFFFWASQWSHVTPPVASACFVAAPLADAPFWPLSWRSMVLSIPMYILPFLFVYNPAILGRGNPIVIAVVFVGCIMGVTLIAAGVAGYFIRAAGWLQRIVLLISGFFILFLLSFIH